jgi:hypothetical protein
MREPMDKNRIGGGAGRTSGRETAKSRSVNGERRKSGGCAQKAVELTPGGLRRVWQRTETGGHRLTAAQKSAEGIIGAGNEPVIGVSPTQSRRTHRAEGPNGPRKGLNGRASRSENS